MPLPFKQRPYLPNNEPLAIVTLASQKEISDQEYKEHYVKLMEEVIRNGNAENVCDEWREGEKCYIPHHEMYHSKKPGKLHIDFDYSAK